MSHKFVFKINQIFQVGSSEIPRFSELGITTEAEDKKEKVKVQSEGDSTLGLSQETCGHSHESNTSSDVTDDSCGVDPSNNVDPDFSVSLPIVSQSANLPLLSDLLSKETVG